ncbi:hypothetical protein ColTof4_14072 [Colletotrichum tofieldiae]|nr:hypothetical protein ColTof3_14709 [Colletotrichum tofieldiae]GKT81649.1 hypothetical protein ColTof4_14072 [Colletotrichum tofieldiae]GKT97621.1 hypothetical protein Ct61P_15471 [Colletotrichum tofieldiae]
MSLVDCAADGCFANPCKLPIRCLANLKNLAPYGVHVHNILPKSAECTKLALSRSVLAADYYNSSTENNTNGNMAPTTATVSNYSCGEL